MADGVPDRHGTGVACRYGLPQRGSANQSPSRRSQHLNVIDKLTHSLRSHFFWSSPAFSWRLAPRGPKGSIRLVSATNAVPPPADPVPIRLPFSPPHPRKRPFSADIHLPTPGALSSLRRSPERGLRHRSCLSRPFLADNCHGSALSGWSARACAGTAWRAISHHVMERPIRR